MAFYNLTTLVQRTITRLRMVSGPSAQLYAEDAIAMMLEETYEMVRAERWWDHLMRWETRQLSGTNGLITTDLLMARERFRDIQHIFYASYNQPLPILSSDINPYRLVGTVPRFVEPLDFTDDPTGSKLFRIWPLTSATTVAQPIRIRVRLDPPGIFENPATMVPFDATCLINGAAFKYAADDGTNPASIASLQSAFEARLKQLKQQHDSAVIILDPRQTNPNIQDEWMEER